MPPVIQFRAVREALATRCVLEVQAEHAGQVEEGLLTLAELDRAWGPEGELATLTRSAVGSAVPLGWESLLLIGQGPASGVRLDLHRRTATPTAAVRLPGLRERHALAARLVAQELADAGCLTARVGVGESVSVLDARAVSVAPSSVPGRRPRR